MAETVNTSGSWWQQNAPSVRTLGSTPSAQAPAPNAGFGSLGNLANTPTGFTDQQITGMMNGQQPQMQTQRGGGGDPQALIQQYQQSHPPGDIAGLMSFLQQNGINVSRPTHAGGTLQSDDKLVINGQMIDLIGDVGGANAKWQYNVEGAGGGGQEQGGAFGSLAQGWDQQYNAPSAEDAMNSPGIQAALKLGSQAIQRSAAAKGTLLTGGTLKDLTGFANDLGSQAYGDVWNRGMQQYQDAKNSFYTNQNNLFGRNFSLAQLGQNAASDTGMQGQNFANASSDLYGQQGNAQSAGTVAGTQAWMPSLGALGNLGVDLTTRHRSSY